MKNGEVIVVDVRQIEVAVGKPASKRDGKKQVVVVDVTVIVSVGVGKILYKLDPALPENTQRNGRVDALKFAAELSVCGSRRSRQRIGELKAILLRPLRYAKDSNRRECSEK